MAQPISPIQAEMRLAQIFGNDFLAQAPETIGEVSPAANPGQTPALELSDNPFEVMLNKAIESLNSVSHQEVYANQMVDKYLKGEAEIADVMAAQAKMNVMVQLAVTTVNTAVTTFKEITQLQV